MGAYLWRKGIIQKPVPPLVRQPMVFDPDLGGMMISPTCWAAALSSWLKATRNVDRSVDYIVGFFRHYVTSKGLDLSQFGEIAEALFVRMDYEEVDRADLSWDYLWWKLEESAIYLILENANPAHALVLYAISEDRAGTQEVWLVDPIQGMRAGSLREFQKRSPTFLVGVARKG